MSEKIQKQAILVGICKNSSELTEAEISINELERLLNTAGAEAIAKVIQIKESYDPRTLIGSGKVKEISDLVNLHEVELVVFDEELTPAQIRNLENDIDGDVTVIDRSMLILDIFALHATSGEGKLQVELAQLKYTAPRLIGKGSQLSRQGGGIGTRGPGESKLETDRRHLHEKTVALEARLRELESNRAIMRVQRDRSGLPKIALVGYTNAGKSTLLNALTGANVLSEDKLFATLDPTTRKMTLPGGEEVLLTDTVGFIRKLPHHLVKAFRSTLDEVRFADILMLVSDASDPEIEEHIRVTEEVIKELGAEGKSIVYVYNKIDMCPYEINTVTAENTVFVSASKGTGIDCLLNVLEDIIHKSKKQVVLLIPYTEQSKASDIFNNYNVKNTEYTEEGVLIEAVLDNRGIGLYGKFIKS